MPRIAGERSIEIDAPIKRCFDLVSDPHGTVEWQDSLKAVNIAEEDDEGHPVLVETTIDAVARDVTLVLRFDWEEPTELRFAKVSGDVKDIRGAWTLEDLGGDRTKATYHLDIDPGRVLGMLAWGPLVGQLRKHLTAQPPEGLKRAAEAVA
jgi:uncharacterized protein YndB with AHSA1/START domain